MNKYLFCGILIFVIILPVSDVGAINKAKDSYKLLCETDKHVFLQVQNDLLVFRKWQPVWYIIGYENEISEIIHKRKDEFIVDGKEAIFSDFKRTLYFKNTRKMFHGKATNFDMKTVWSDAQNKYQANSIDEWEVSVTSTIYRITYSPSLQYVQYSFLVNRN